MATSDQKRKHRVRELAVSKTFKPRFWEQVDGRFSVKKRIRLLYKRLHTDAGVDSVQKDMLCQRAAFMAVQLESMECHAAEDGKLDAGVYTQMNCALSGLLSKLGLDRQLKGAGGLKAYLGDKAG